MASANISFYVVTGGEIHWHQAHSIHRDAAAIKTLLSGLTGFLVVEGLVIVAAWFLGNYLYDFTGAILDILGNSMKYVLCCCRRKRRPDPQSYERIECQEYSDESRLHAGRDDDNMNMNRDESEEHLLSGRVVDPSEKTAVSLLKRLLVLLPTTVILVLRCVRPPDPAFFFLSWSIPLQPLVDGRQHRGPPVEVSGLKGDYGWLTNQTALTEPPVFDWLPKDSVLPGFEDWAPAELLNLTIPQVHYNASQDPIRISNLKEEILQPIKDALDDGSVKVKHIVFLKLESTRADVFPLSEDGYVWQRIQDSFGNDKMPKEVQERLAKLTRTSERLTGFQGALTKKGDRPEPYGGLSARNAYTSGTYTLKSLVGSLCGVSPLVADFNREFSHHIYQPCLAQVFSALNTQTDTGAANKTNSDFTTWPWHSKWMQSVTQTYDNQRNLTPIMGYHDMIDKEWLDSPDHEGRRPDSGEVNYYGYPDTVLRDHVREALDKAESEHHRLFLTHLTGITHHPWGMPDDKYEELMGHNWYGNNDDMNRYLNTIGFVDNWLNEILEILEEKGVANETLIVMAGDHGLSLPFDNGVTPYDNPRVGNFHIPIVLAHPNLPPVEIESPVLATQIVPTILDLLLESSSLDAGASRAARDILPLYEGQSMIRSLKQEENDKQDWQFSVMNTGGSWLAVRSASEPYRLVIPLINDIEWRFSNLEVNPHELLPPIKDFDVNHLAMEVERIHGPFALKWVGEAAHVAQWWVAENWRRYRFDPEHPDPIPRD